MPDTVRIRMAGYGPPTTTFSRGLRLIHDVLTARLGDDIRIELIWNIMDHGHTPEDLFSLVDGGTVTLAYLSTSGMTTHVPLLALADLPFLFADEAQAREAIDGALGAYMREAIAQSSNLLPLGFFENGFRHLSNRLRPVARIEDLAGMRMRVMNSAVHHRTFELLGTQPQRMGLKAFVRCLQDGEVDAQENPYANTADYGVHRFHRFHTETRHFYVSRAVFVHRPAFETWPDRVRESFREAVSAAVTEQRRLATLEEAAARKALADLGGAVVVPDATEMKRFRMRVNSVHEETAAALGAEARSLLRSLQ